MDDALAGGVRRPGGCIPRAGPPNGGPASIALPDALAGELRMPDAPRCSRRAGRTERRRWPVREAAQGGCRASAACIMQAELPVAPAAAAEASAGALPVVQTV